MIDPLPIAVLIPTWNNWEDTRLCLESIGRLDPPPGRIMIVDNGSTDGTPDRITTHWPGVELLALDSNEGFSRAVNRGLRALLEDGDAPEAIFLINNDVVLSPGVLGQLWTTLNSDSAIAGVCPLITYIEPSDRIWYGGGEVSLWRGHIGHRYLRQAADRVPEEVVDTDYLTGAAALLRSESLRAVGVLDEVFLFYAEDADWSLRARREGWRLLFDPAGRVAHRVSASMGGQFSRRKIFTKIRMMTRFFRRHARPGDWLTVVPGLLFVTLPQVAGGLLRLRR